MKKNSEVTTMEKQNNVETIKQAHQNFNRHDMESAAKNVAENITYRNHARGVVINNRQGFIEYLEAWKKGFSDARVTEPTYIDGGDKVVALATARGTNDGPFGDFPSTNKKIENPVCEVLHFNDEGKIVAGEIYYDRMTMLEQLGHVGEAQMQ